MQIASLLNYRIICNTSFTSVNVLGPREEIAVMGNPITYIRVNSSSLPHVRLQILIVFPFSFLSAVSRIGSLSGMMWGD